MINLLQEFKGFKILPEASFDEINVDKTNGFIHLHFRINRYDYFLILDYAYSVTRYAETDKQSGCDYVNYDGDFEIYNIERFEYCDYEETFDVEVELTSDEEKEFIDCIGYSILGEKIVEYLDNL